MAIARSRSRRNLELQMQLGASGEPGQPAEVGRAPETPMKEASPHHILSVQGVLSGTEGGTGSRNITAPSGAGAESAAIPNIPGGTLNQSEELSRSAARDINAINSGEGAGALKQPTAAEQVNRVLQYSPQNLTKKYLIKKSLAAATKGLLGKKAAAGASKSGVAKLLSYFL